MSQTHADRRERLRDMVHAVGAEAALVTRLVNVRYLTGFTGSNAALLVTDREDLLCTDGRYLTQAQQESPGLELVVDRECAPALIDRAGRDGVRRLAFEAHDVTVELHAELAAMPGAPEMMPLGHAVETLRTVKDDGELALLREACAIGDQALLDTLDGTAPGQTEREVARRLEAAMVDFGADGIAFETIVATGPNSAIPHHQPTDREILRGDLLKIDFGARYQGYHADCTRTVLVGSAPAEWQSEIYDVVRRAQRAGRHALTVGADLRAVDDLARQDALELGADDGAALARLVVLEPHDRPELAVQVQHQAVLEVVRRRHGHVPSSAGVTLVRGPAGPWRSSSAAPVRPHPRRGCPRCGLLRGREGRPRARR